ncbi:ferredoxin-NADP reductase [Marinobacterium iners]|uniref:2Fe-2S iron-sulfur cluster binding domain-containing protein n=1 Tax=Marinobacterium iners TaxID=48076 RepID=UPI001A8F4873|nr:2Fe-2S iron-sulfur cluster binding domain-containing protein [Marinobacterium iners]QSR36195.1 ferredoxin-NADP reductase [Marinobacterium iners]
MPIIKINNNPISIQSSTDHSMLTDLLNAGIGYPYECVTGKCGLCKFELIQGNIIKTEENPTGLSSRDLKKGNRHLACKCKLNSDLDIKVKLDNKFIQKTKISKIRSSVISKELLTHDFIKITLKPDENMSWLPGQFCLLSDPLLPSIDRAYSIANNYIKDGHIDFYIKRVPDGIFSNHIFDKINIDSTLILKGPFGHSYYQRSNRKLLIIGGGSGLSYAASIAKQAFSEGKDFLFYYGSRSTQDIPNWSSLVFTNNEIIDIKTVLSQSNNEWTGPTGFLHEVVNEDLGASLCEFDIYLAGPPVMVECSIKSFFDQGVPSENIHYDSFY